MKNIKSQKTIKGNEIQAFVFENSDSKQTIYVIGVVHGNELEGEYIINQIKERLEKEAQKLNNNIILIPCFNPDGKDLNIRGNGRGVDLNRNYNTVIKKWKPEYKQPNRFPGEFAESEIETKFLLDLTKKYKPDLVITIHSPLKNVNYDGDERAKRIAKGIADYVGYPLKEVIAGEKGFHGSMGTYFGYDNNTPIITIELESCVKDRWLDDFKKAINVQEPKDLLVKCLGKIKKIIDQENLNILFFKKDLQEEYEKSNLEILDCLNENLLNIKFEKENIDFQKIRDVFTKNGRELDLDNKEVILNKFIKIISRIIGL